ncbi:exported hypothetical protein [Arthrobacter sp. 9V]|nr:exported hypothetical protein [Arthrobacter sp. 9V]
MAFVAPVRVLQLGALEDAHAASFSGSKGRRRRLGPEGGKTSDWLQGPSTADRSRSSMPRTASC